MATTPAPRFHSINLVREYLNKHRRWQRHPIPVVELQYVTGSGGRMRSITLDQDDLSRLVAEGADVLHTLLSEAAKEA